LVGGVVVTDVYTLPPDLPVPLDDGAADHLRGAVVPAVTLTSTSGESVDMARLAGAPAVMFFYPRTGARGTSAGPAWDLIPGARGCTPQSCGFRDLHAEFRTLGVTVVGISTQTTAYQQEFVERNHVPFALLSDADLVLTRGLRLPTFEWAAPDWVALRGGPTTLIKRMAWYVDRGEIEHVWYPVFPPDKNAETVLAWLRARP
jgi:peroxiredoxin